MGSWLNEKVMPQVMRFVNTPAIQALKDGMVGTIPLIITGSIFLILGQLPVEALAEAIRNAGLEELFLKAYGATFQINAIVAVTGIAYAYIKNAGYEPYSGCMVALGSFLTIQPNARDIFDESGEVIGTASSIIDKTWTGGQGMVAAIIVGLLVGWGYSAILRRDIRIRMPEGVPEGVANAFTALIPAMVIITVTMILEGIATLGFGDDLISLIYTWIGIPLQGLTDSYVGVLVATFLISFLWFFGVHGSSVVSGVLGGIWTANYLENEELFQAGNLTLDTGHIVTQQFVDQFITVTGSGLTVGIAIYCLFFAKSEQFKTLGRLEIGPAIFNINEPILFGIPIVMNPILGVPFILVPMFSATIEYVAIATGLCPMYRGILVPWTTPPIISGFLVGDWRTAVLQLVIIVMSIIVYFPFIRIVDKQAVVAQETSTEDDDDEDW
ncbi:MAG: PTS sugar transporter subunit IIC [Lachnospiraceae bacterium]|nr:PTS sugar transporter subunit IIC [Lachnospiraceae bacterium]